MPSETFTYSATTSAARDTVWAALQEPETWEGIAGVDKVNDPVVDHNGALRGFTFDSEVAGKAYVGTAIPAGRQEGREMAWNIETTDVAGLVTVQLDDDNGSTLVAVTLAVESRGMLAGVFFPLISSTIGNGFPQSVEEFAAGLD